MQLLLKMGIYALAIYLAVNLVPGITSEAGAIALLVPALVLGVVNGLVKPVVTLLSLPLILLTLGLFLVVINVAAFWLVVELVPTLEAAGFASIVVGALVVSLTVWVGEFLVERA